jgi:threonine/homoserine/homoserine lactone efflux protein
MISPMFGIENFGLFLTAGILLNLTPGQDTAYILGRSIAQARRAGIASALGSASGGVPHVGGGSGFVHVSSYVPWAFTSVKMIGAAYLVFLGLRALFKRASPLQLPSQLASLNTMVVFRQGVITSVLNPKVALFFLAFFCRSFC